MANAKKTPSTYIWQHDDWPRMTVRTDSLAGLLAEANTLRGYATARKTPRHATSTTSLPRAYCEKLAREEEIQATN